MEAKGSPSPAAAQTDAQAETGLGNCAWGERCCRVPSGSTAVPWSASQAPLWTSFLGCREVAGRWARGDSEHSSTAPDAPAPTRGPRVHRGSRAPPGGSALTLRAPRRFRPTHTRLRHRTSALLLSSAGGEAIAGAPKEDTEDRVVWMPFLTLQLETRGVRFFWEQTVTLFPHEHQAHPALRSLARLSFLCPVTQVWLSSPQPYEPHASQGSSPRHLHLLRIPASFLHTLALPRHVLRIQILSLRTVSFL